jgi:hypothetical protein
MVELCSVAERTLNYLHTGSSKVLATGVMSPLWTSQALLDHGLPAISPMVVRLAVNNITICSEKWPYNPMAVQPYMASKRSHVITYGHNHLMVGSFRIYILITKSPSDINNNCVI